MSNNKNAVLRYNVLDKCFSNFGRKYFFNDLLEIVNDTLFEDNPKSSGIKTRQLREDIKFMKSEVGYAAPIVAYPDMKLDQETLKNQRKAYYRYEDKSFSINNSPLNSTEAEQLRNAIHVLQRFEGSPEFEWVNEISPMLTDKFGLKNADEKVMSYDSNIDYSGYKHITPLFNAIVNKRVLEIEYKPFGKKNSILIFHPFHLKQFNNRWFVFGYNEELEIETWNLALDRVLKIKETSKSCRSNSMDWEEYFYDFIGVSKEQGDPIELELLFSKQQAPYIQTKPLHPSQKSKLMDDGSLHVRLSIIPNYELEMKLLSFGEKVKILSSGKLITTLKKRLKLALEQY
jgi:predicted DNA-binding transcriptional regulator YafY